MTKNQPEVRIVILNYNGEALLPQCLPSIREAAQKASYPVHVTLLDNQSRDKALDYARREFPEFDIELAPENKVLCSYNAYLKKMKEPIAILLNNDIRVAPDFIDPLVRPFLENPDTFLAAPKVMSFDGSTVEAGKTIGEYRWGLFWSSARYPGFENEMNQRSETFSSGFGAFSREKFLELGGYDERFLPGIFEDADICLRARRAGYKLFYEPASIVFHMGQASFKKAFGPDHVAALAHRNNFLFLWKNFSGPVFWSTHVLFAPLRILWGLVRGKTALARGFSAALKRNREIS